MRKIKITPNEYYHVFNRGNNKQDIFLDERDWARFLFLLLYMQSPVTLFNISSIITNFIKHRVFNSSQKIKDKIIENRMVELIAFALMPNHFHIIIKEMKEGGISRYMQRVLNAYTKYFNIKYKKTGHLFQGPFKIVHIEDNKQLLHLSAYIHRNPREIKRWKNKEYEFSWSSFQDYLKENRWGDLLAHQIILEQFSNTKEYREFVDTSGTKILEEDHLNY
jgi:putative transposase